MIKIKIIKVFKILRLHYIWRPFFSKLAKPVLYSREGNIYLEKYKAIFFPIPKVACSSFKKFFSDVLEIKEVKNRKIANLKRKQPEEEEVHRIDFPYVLKQDIKNGKYKHCFKFAFVRNPWDRILSCYLNKVYQKDFILDENGVIRKIKQYNGNVKNFEDFVKIINNIPDSEANSHFKSQYLFVTDEKGELVTDYIGTLEDINKDFKFVCEKIGIKKNDLPKLMSSSSKNYREYYNEETKKIIAKRYKKDIELFNYNF